MIINLSRIICNILFNYLSFLHCQAISDDQDIKLICLARQYRKERWIRWMNKMNLASWKEERHSGVYFNVFWVGHGQCRYEHIRAILSCIYQAYLVQAKHV